MAIHPQIITSSNLNLRVLPTLILAIRKIRNDHKIVIPKKT